MKTKGRATEVDKHVGIRVRNRRNLLGWSQENLADKLNLTFQQVQKYENGVNRIGASRLYELSRIFDVPVEYFFEGLGKGKEKNVYGFSESDQVSFTNEQVESKETSNLIRAYYTIPDENIRRKVLDLAKTLAQAFEPDEK